MSKVGLYVFGVYFLWCGAAIAASRSYMMSQCRELMNNNPPPAVRVIYNYGNLSVNEEKSTDEISRIYKDVHGEQAKDDVNKAGLTVLNFYDTVSVSVIYYQLSDGYMCYFPAQVDVKVGYQNTVIYLDKKLDRKSCLYKLTQRHELQHLGLAHQTLPLYASAIKGRISDVIREVGVKVSTISPEEAANELATEYRLRLLVISALYNGALAEEQAKLDTPENYKKERALCH